MTYISQSCKPPFYTFSAKRRQVEGLIQGKRKDAGTDEDESESDEEEEKGRRIEEELVVREAKWSAVRQEVSVDPPGS